jgi:hypothetical protein
MGNRAGLVLIQSGAVARGNHPERLTGMSVIRKLFSNQPFLVHSIVYAGVNLLLFVIDMLTGPETTWFQWPLLGWGIGLIGHAFLVYQSQKTNSA